jgi:DNA-binding transcriptional ArsR family regulator
MTSRSLLWYLLVGTRGGANRWRILDRLQLSPMNAHELSEALALDYRTVRHHLTLLESAGVIARPLGGVYGSPYEVTAYLMANAPGLEELRRERTRRSGPLGRPAVRRAPPWRAASP